MIDEHDVLNDMEADKGVVSSAARDYFYIHYADRKTRKHMDIEDTIANIIIAFGYVVTFLTIGVIIYFKG